MLVDSERDRLAESQQARYVNKTVVLCLNIIMILLKTDGAVIQIRLVTSWLQVRQFTGDLIGSVIPAMKDAAIFIVSQMI
jgi:hypothetical protein